MILHRCLRTIGRIFWKKIVSDLEAESRVLNPTVHPLEEAVDVNTLRWL